MYHIELRQFPHSAWRFNLTEAELRAIAEPWSREQVVEVGERRWSSEKAKLTILDGPHLDVSQLSMGRGWTAAQHDGQDVTDRVLALARQAGERARSAEPPPGQASAEASPHAGPAAGLSGAGLARSAAPATGSLGDPIALGVQLAALLGADAIALLDAWRAAAARSPELTPSESLALAEHSLRSGASERR